jgi:hypothetical protein
MVLFLVDFLIITMVKTVHQARQKMDPCTGGLS